MLKKLKELAFAREVSRGSIIREALRKYFEEQEQPSQVVKPNPKAKVNDKTLDAILKECSAFFGGFEIDNEDGFIEVMKDNNIKLKDLTDEQFKRILDKLKLGYKGYFTPPSPEEWLAKFEELEPTEEQSEQLAQFVSEKTEESEEFEEEEWE